MRILSWVFAMMMVFVFAAGAGAFTPENRMQNTAQETSTQASQGKETAEPGKAVKQADSAKALKLLDEGELAFVSGKFEKARNLWKQALQARPGWDKAEERLANLDKRAEWYKKEMALIKKRRQARLDFVEGITAFNAGDYQKAVDAFTRHLKVFPDSSKGRTYLNLAKEWAAKKK